MAPAAIGRVTTASGGDGAALPIARAERSKEQVDQHTSLVGSRQAGCGQASDGGLLDDGDNTVAPLA